MNTLQIDEAALAALKEDPEFLEEIIGLFIKMGPELLNESAKALANGNGTEAAGYLHQLRPNMELVGLGAYAPKMFDLEKELKSELLQKDALMEELRALQAIMSTSVDMFKAIL
jgi:HPt (histidine-containing phosphotransfer) domain-containing protein